MTDARPRLRDAAAELFLLAGFAIALPLFDVVREGPDFLIAHRATALDLIVLTALACGLVPVLLLGLEVLAGRWRSRARRALHEILVALLAALYALRLLNALLAPSSAVALIASLAAGLGLALLLRRVPATRRFLLFASPAAVLVPALFLGTEPVRPILVSREAPEPEASAGAFAPQTTPSIVLVVFDELPLVSLLDANGAIDAKRFPSFARLARTSYWFREATAVSDSTPGAITSIVAGRHDAKKRMASYRTNPRTLFTLLADTHDLNVWEILTDLVPPELRGEARRRRPGLRLAQLLLDAGVVYAHLVVPVDLRAGLPQLEGRWNDFLSLPGGAEERREKGWSQALFGAKRGRVFRDFIASISAADRPTLHFLHSMLPHSPWVHLPDGQLHRGDPSPGLSQVPWKPRSSAAPRSGTGPRRNEDGPNALLRRHQMHLLQTRYADRLLGELLDHLRREALFEQVLLIVTADHGTSFLAGEPIRAPNEANHAEVMFVPLLIKLPGQRESITTAVNAQTIDLLPTVAAAMGGALPFRVAGVALFGEVPERPQKRMFSRSTDRLVYPVGPARRALRAALRRNIERFDLRSPGSDLYRFGPFGAVIGEPVAGLRRQGQPLELAIEGAEGLLAVDLEAPELPVWLAGELAEDRVPDPSAALTSAAASPAATLAFVLNGVLAATSELDPADGDSREFAVILPPDLLRAGANDLAVYWIVRDADGHPTLRGAD